MARKILECNIKTIDEKSHVHFWSLKDIDVDSVRFLADKPKEKKPIHIIQKGTVTKKIKKIINKN